MTIIPPNDVIIQQSEITEKEIVQSNKLTLSKHNFSLMEKRAIYLIILQIRQAMNNEITLQEDLFGDILIRFSPQQVLKASKRYQDVYGALSSLKKKNYIINTNEIWEDVSIVENPKHFKKENYFQVRVPKAIAHLFAVKIKNGDFTAFEAHVALTLQKTSSQRLYEYCNKYKSLGGFYLSFSDFRERMELDKRERYSRWSNIKNDFLEPAREELYKLYNKSQCDLYFEYSPHKEGRSTKGIKFKIIADRGILDNELSLEDQLYYCKMWLNALFQSKDKKKNGKYVNDVIKHIQAQPVDCTRLYSKLARIKRSYAEGEQPKVVRKMIDTDFLNVQNHPNGD